MRPNVAMVAAVLFVTASASECAQAADAVPSYVTAAVADPGRPPREIRTDAARNPSAVLAFSGVKPGDVVADFIPGEGYYTRLLARLVGVKGKVYPFVPLANGLRDVEEERRLETAMRAAGKNPPFRSADPVLAIENIAEYNNVTVIWENLNQYGGQFGLPEQLDTVFIADAYHDLRNNVYKTPDMLAVNRSIFRAIKPGGSYVVVDYAAPVGDGISDIASLGRIDPERVKSDIVAAGFVLDGESRALANPADDYTKPANDPSLRGKPDRLLIRFRKPVTAVGNNRPTTDPLANYYGNTYVYNFDAKGDVSGNRPRWHYYHPDGTYQEFGTSDMQAGRDYWDTDGHNCQLHQFPPAQRGWTVCHALMPLKVGEVQSQDNGIGDGPKHVTLIAGKSALKPATTP